MRRTAMGGPTVGLLGRAVAWPENGRPGGGTGAGGKNKPPAEVAGGGGDRLVLGGLRR
ncbi:MAG: hypothetical protein LW650_09110 [Planctomycetaceae bacterium]|nr:hypothetical protein [Planctomycetaceae bacterium]